MKRVALETALWVIIVLVYLGNSKSRGRTLLGSEEINVAETESERERDFIEWVERVGSRIREQTSNASQVNESESESESKVAALVITVDENAGQYKSLQAAIDAVPSNNNQRVVIQIAAGIYQEKVIIPKTKAFITFEGAGADSTIITWYDTAGSAGSTHDSASVAINSDYFIGKGITFKNSATPPSSGAVNQQAVALRISGDKASFFNCNFLGAQDTLYDDKGRHYFENCYIEGSVDFICGDGQSLYKGCNLHAISSGSLTAQSRQSLNEDTGFSFVDCKVTGPGMLYLGRAWGPYSRVVFSYTYMDNIIIPQGWYDWGDASRQNSIFYGEYKCSGPGASQKGRVAWAYQLSDVQAAPFQTLSFVDGEQWLQP